MFLLQRLNILSFYNEQNKLVSMGNSNYKNLTCDVLYQGILFLKKEVYTEAE